MILKAITVHNGYRLPAKAAVATGAANLLPTKIQVFMPPQPPMIHMDLVWQSATIMLLQVHQAMK